MQRFNIYSRFLFILLSAFFFTNKVSAQLSKHGNIWYFGYQSGLDFSTGNPAPLYGINVNTFEGCASWCDAKGNMVVYTNGGGDVITSPEGLNDGIIWNRNQQVMYNMDQTHGGGFSSPQSAIILPNPADTTQLYIFTMDHFANLSSSACKGLSYFLMDTKLNGGLGDFVQKDVRLYKPAAESLTAVPISNGSGYWVIIVDSLYKGFILYPLTASGIGTPIKHPRNESDDVHVIKASPDGKYLFTDSELYQFDASNGDVTFVKHVPVDGYTCTFSPGSRYLYGLVANDTLATGAIVRYDLAAPDLLGSLQVVHPGFLISLLGLMQIGPDGNIYFNEQSGIDFDSIDVSVIRCPDGSHPEAQRPLYKFPVSPDFLYNTSLPNYADYIYVQHPSVDTTTAKICSSGGSLVLQPKQGGAHPVWSTGETTPTITVKTPGLYSVQFQDSCHLRQIVFKVQPTVLNAAIDLPVRFDTCNPFPAILHATVPPGTQFHWGDGSTADTLLVKNFGQYTLHFTSAATGCSGDTSIEILPHHSCCNVKIADVFTPNNDQLNDTFGPISPGCVEGDLETISIEIYSRWGELVFRDVQNTKKWDGKSMNGTDAPSDVYVYVLRYKQSGKEEKIGKGQVTLLR